VRKSLGLKSSRLTSKSVELRTGRVPQRSLLGDLSLELNGFGDVTRQPLGLAFQVLLGGDGIGELVIVVKREIL
jgi:hypothetical protein